MSTIKDTAEQFFEACETGKGWPGCEPYCHPGATFAAQTDALADVTTLEAYTEWMKGLMAILPDGRAEVRSFGDGGPVPPTGKSAEADYVYVMDFDGDKIRHMTKIWNDGITMRQLGWA
jgi:hypothetical protein